MQGEVVHPGDYGIREGERLSSILARAGGLRSDYTLKTNSYDLAVDIELYDIVQRLRFEHPEVATVVLTGGLDKIFCAGANIDGPAILAERNATTVVEPGWRASVTDASCIDMRRVHPRAARVVVEARLRRRRRRRSCSPLISSRRRPGRATSLTTG